MTNKHYVLAELMCARKRVELVLAEIEHIEIGLKFDIITADQAARAILLDKDIHSFTRMLHGERITRDAVSGIEEAIDAQVAS